MNQNYLTPLKPIQSNVNYFIENHRLTPWQVICLGIYYTIGKSLPSYPFPGGWVGMELRRFLASQLFQYCGQHVRIHGVNFGSGHKIKLGENSSLGPNCWIASDTEIGEDVMIAPWVTILSNSHNFDRTDISMREQGAPPPQKVTIGDDVWIGTRSIILPGVTIGAHSIVGAGSVVTKDVPDWAIVAGNPAKIVRFRNETK